MSSNKPIVPGTGNGEAASPTIEQQRAQEVESPEDAKHNARMKGLRAERARNNPHSRASFRKFYGHEPEAKK